MAPHSSTLAWKLPWTEEPRLQSMRVSQSQIRLSNFTFTFHFHALEKEMATQSSILAWRIPGMGEPCGLPSMGSHRVGHDWGDLVAAAAWALLPCGTWNLSSRNPHPLSEGGVFLYFLNDFIYLLVVLSLFSSCGVLASYAVASLGAEHGL